MLPLERQEHYRARYAQLNPGWRPATHVYREWIARRLTGQARVLDLGCGRGGVLEQLYHTSALLVGTDPDIHSLYEHRLPGLIRVAGRGEHLPYSDRAFDLVCCSWVLEHLEFPEQFFAEVARVLAPSGHFVFLTPNAHHPLLLLNRLLSSTQISCVRRLYGRSEADTFPAVYRANTLRRLRKLAGAAGLTEVKLITIEDPTYLAFTEWLFRLAALAETVLPYALHVHIVGEFMRV